ncbi:hypothetical protein ACFCZ3_19760 [Cellulosimicrobium cellulans]|uniref:hypothetical protein n=1 Tax=Cellulosimicrobium cellulans TaxID=1710 RepID=UPI0035D8577F
MSVTTDTPVHTLDYTITDERLAEDLALVTPTLAPAENGDEPYEESLDERFQRFHAANPHVYTGLRDLALPIARLGKKTSIKMLWEVLRYQELVRTQGEEFVLNNSFTSRYARLLMEQEPALRGLFATRELRS